MNIFIMVLLAVFMVGYYMISSPSQRIQSHETEYAVGVSDMRGIAECTAAVHNAQIKGGEFRDICVQQNNIESRYICLNRNQTVTKCEIVRNKKPDFSFIITVTAPLDESEYNSMMEILEKHYPDAGTFGILQGNQIISGGTSNKRIVPKGIISDMKLQDGQLIYMTQYEIPDTQTEFSAPVISDVNCPAGTIKTYRFGRWQCIEYNTKTNCGGDMVWDIDMQECVPDESRKPLCAKTQTAVIVDEVWECINPFPERSCPDNMIARLNYSTLEWECVSDPTIAPDVKKCGHITGEVVFGALGTTMRVTGTTCTDCEKLVIDSVNCVSKCVPDETKMHNARCYAGNINECSDTNRGIYFGFPNKAYADKAAIVPVQTIPFDGDHLQNRRFNCMTCRDGKVIDQSVSQPPFTAVCK